MNEMFHLMLAEQQKQSLAAVMKCNDTSEKFGIVLTEKEAGMLMEYRAASLKDNRRIEFGGGILPDIIYAFCDSEYIGADEYADTLAALQEIFYSYKNESQDERTDQELLDFMRKQYDDICFGDLDYLSGTCLERFARSVRSGYRCKMKQKEKDEYALEELDHEYESLSEEVRWDYNVYMTKLEDTY